MSKKFRSNGVRTSKIAVGVDLILATVACPFLTDSAHWKAIVDVDVELELSEEVVFVLGHSFDDPEG